MALKALIVAQILLDLIFGAFLIWWLWKPDGRIKIVKKKIVEPPPDDAQSNAEIMKELEGQFIRWEQKTLELAGLMESRIRDLQNLADELDRAEIQAAETLQEFLKAKSAWTSNDDQYNQALQWLREGLPLEEVANRCGISVDELRLIQGLSSKNRGEA